MAARRVGMRKIYEILRLLWHLDLGVRQTARSCTVSHSTVLDYQRRAEKAGLSWEDVTALEAAEMEARLFPPAEASSARPLPNWAEVYKELKGPGMTLQLLWEE